MALIAGLALAMPLAAKDPQPALPNWLHGAWIQEGSDGQWADEYWTPPRGGLMIGAARMGRGDRVDLFEHTRIVRLPDGQLVFYGQPFGREAAAFPLVASDAAMMEFANAAHDYPQRIRYWREGTELRARVSLMDGSRAQEWRYRMMGGRPD
jgi:hypothetical protein